MYDPASYFDLSASSHAALFTGCEQVWQALTRLQGYVQAQVAQAAGGLLLPADLGNGIPLAAPLVLHEGRVLSGRHFAIASGSIAKGELAVRDEKGRLLAGASVVMAGAVLMGSGIKIGRGDPHEAGPSRRPREVGPASGPHEAGRATPGAGHGRPSVRLRVLLRGRSPGHCARGVDRSVLPVWL